MRRYILFLCTLALACAQAETLNQILKRMDAAAPDFHAMTATVKQVSFTAIINDLDEETGTITLQRLKPKDTRMLVIFTKPDPRSVAFAGRQLQIFYPKMNTVQEYDLGKQASLVDQFLLLGFGASGSDLKSAYDIQYAGAETLLGQPTWRLDLKPKSKEAQQHVKHIELWIAESNAQPVQQKVWTAQKDYRLITYTDLKINPSLTPDAVTLKLPADVKKEYPQK